MKKLLVSLAAVLLVGCATIQTQLMDLGKLKADDIQAALVLATQANDKAAMQCYPVLLQELANLAASTGQPAPDVKGLVSVFQLARNASKKVQSGATTGQSDLVQRINLGCAALFNDTQGDVLRLGVMFRP